MAVNVEGGDQQNGFAPQPTEAANQRENQERHMDFSGAGYGEAPLGSLDVIGLKARLGISRIDSAVEPYLDNVMKLVKDNLKNIELLRMERMSNSYVIKFDGEDGVSNFFGIYFVNLSDPISQNFTPASARLRLINEELRQRFDGRAIRIVDSRVIIAGFEGDMSRAYEMADTIVRTFQVAAIPQLKDAQISSFQSTEFTADWRLSEARSTERQLSPHGIPPRMEIGFTLKAKVRNNMGREFNDIDTEYQTIGVIGGYTEMRDREEFTVNNQRVMLYQPVFHITVLNAAIPLEGVMGILLAAFAPSIYSSYVWAKQWADLTGDNKPNPGMLDEDPAARGKPLKLADMEELREWLTLNTAKPVIAFDFQDGRDSIPGAWRLGSTNSKDKTHLMNRLAHFFGADEVSDVGAFPLSEIIERRFDGAYGEVTGQLSDTRDIDYLYIAAKLGWGAINDKIRHVMLNFTGNEVDRARIIAEVTNSFIPLYLNNVAAINPELLSWIIERTNARRLTIIDPTSHTEARPMGSVLSAFGSANNLGSIVTNGATNRGLGLQSIWQY